MLREFVEAWVDGRGNFAAVVLAVAMTLVALTVWWAFRGIIRRLFALAARIVETRIPRLKESIEKILDATELILGGALALVLLIAYVPNLLRLFPRTHGVAMGLHGLLVAQLVEGGTALLRYIPKLVFLVALVLITRLGLMLLRQLFSSIEHGHIVWAGFYPEWAGPTFNLMRIFVLLLAAIVGFPYLPAADTEAFKSIGVLAGVLLSLGSTGAVASAIAGFTLTYMRAFRVGDYVSIAGVEGTVEHLSVLTTRLRTPRGETVILPNGSVLAGTVVNYSDTVRGVALRSTVTIGYDVPWRKVHEILRDAAERVKNSVPLEHLVLENPPRILQTALNDFHVGYSLEVFFRKVTDRPALETHLQEAMRDAFDAGGVQILSPAHNTLHQGEGFRNESSKIGS